MIKHETVDPGIDVFLAYLGLSRWEGLLEHFSDVVAFALDDAGLEDIQALLDDVQLDQCTMAILLILNTSIILERRFHVKISTRTDHSIRYTRLPRGHRGTSGGDDKHRESDAASSRGGHGLGVAVQPGLHHTRSALRYSDNAT